MDKLRARVQEGIQDGRLPDTDCLVTWFGRGRGEVCVVCRSRILGSEVSIECDLPEGANAWFHAQCYDVWLSVHDG